MTNARPTLIHLQMGQDVLYVVLSFFILTTVILSLILTQMILARKDERKLDQPPIITLNETQGYYFKSGSSGLNDEFAEKLRTIVIPQLARRGKEYNAHIIEVIGHTDEQPVRKPFMFNASTLDGELLNFVRNRGGRNLEVADNVGLGMARAAAIVRMLRSDERLAQFQILPLSAGQAIDLGDRLADGSQGTRSIQERRRIEVRLRRLHH
jgi:flagellar motor protein MotB